jgi:hypothetical protein
VIWALGTGRCGTRSLAAQLGGVHEPRPWFSTEAIRAYYGDAAARATVREKLLGRLALGVPVVSDLHHSYAIPLICEVDPHASFVWLVRHPMTCIASLLAGGAWTAQNDNSATLWRPADGWPAYWSRLIIGMHYWCSVNRAIWVELDRCGHGWVIQETESLTAHENKYPASRAWTWRPEDAAAIMDMCAQLWLRLRGLLVSQIYK